MYSKKIEQTQLHMGLDDVLVASLTAHIESILSYSAELFHSIHTCITQVMRTYLSSPPVAIYHSLELNKAIRRE